MDAAGAPYERHHAGGDARRCSPDMAVDDLAFSLYEPDACVIRASAAVAALLRRATAAARGSSSTARGPPARGRWRSRTATAPAPTRSSGRAGPGSARCGPALAPVRPSWQDVLHWTRRRPGATARRGSTSASASTASPTSTGSGSRPSATRPGPTLDLDATRACPAPAMVAEVAGYLARRFPPLAGAGLLWARVMPYEMTPDSHFVAGPAESTGTGCWAAAPATASSTRRRSASTSPTWSRAAPRSSRCGVRARAEPRRNSRARRVALVCQVLTRALLLSLLLLVVPAPAVAAPLIGIGEQKPEMFQDARWQALGLTRGALHRRRGTCSTTGAARAARHLDGRRARVRRPRAARLRALAAIGAAAQEAAVRRHVRARVPAHPQALSRGPRLDHLERGQPPVPADLQPAAARSRASTGSCAATAAAAGSSPPTCSTSRACRAGSGGSSAAPITPRIWGLHNYGDTNRCAPTRRAGCSASPAGSCGSPRPAGSSSGASTRAGRSRASSRYSQRHAARATKHVFGSPASAARIRRVYLYHWQAPPIVTNWDSAFLGPTRPVPPGLPHARRQLAAGAAAAARPRRGTPRTPRATTSSPGRARRSRLITSTSIGPS